MSDLTKFNALTLHTPVESAVAIPSSAPALPAGVQAVTKKDSPGLFTLDLNSALGNSDYVFDSGAELQKMEAVTGAELSKGYRYNLLYGYFWYWGCKIFAQKIDAMVNAAATKYYWQVPTAATDAEAKEHLAIFNWWSETVNSGIWLQQNLSSGLQPLLGQALHTGIMEGMNLWHWDMEQVSQRTHPDFPVANKTYNLPMCKGLDSAVKARLLRMMAMEKKGAFSFPDSKTVGALDAPEWIVISIEEKLYNSLRKDDELNALYGFSNYARQKGAARPMETSFAFKYTPNAGISDYPNPFPTGMFDTLEMIKLLSNMDKVTAKGAVRQILYLSVGNEQHPCVEAEVDGNGDVTKNGDLENAKTLFSNINWLNGFAVPNWIKLDLLKGNDPQLLSQDKYNVWFFRLMHEFGIITNKATANEPSNAEIADLDIQQYLSTIESYRQGGKSGGLKAYMEQFMREVIVKDKQNQANGLKYAPIFVWHPMSLNSVDVLKEMRELYMQGLLSNQSILQYHGHSPDVEKVLVEGEGHEFGMPRVSFRQQATSNADGAGRTTVSDTNSFPADHEGRPDAIQTPFSPNMQAAAKGSAQEIKASRSENPRCYLIHSSEGIIGSQRAVDVGVLKERAIQLIGDGADVKEFGAGFPLMTAILRRKQQPVSLLLACDAKNGEFLAGCLTSGLADDAEMCRKLFEFRDAAGNSIQIVESEQILSMQPVFETGNRPQLAVV